MRIDQLTFTRFIAAISIVIFHFGKKIFPFNSEYIDFLFKQANIGVSYFFILSGFIMIISYRNKDNINAIDYYKNRFARIYPIYLLGLLFYLPIRIMLYPLDVTLFFHLSMLQAWFPGWIMSYNFPGWSVSVELFFYILFPFLFNYFYCKKSNFKRYFIVIIFIWTISQIIFNYFINSPFYRGDPSRSHELLFYFPLLHLNEFLIGNLAGLFYLKKHKVLQKNYDLLILFLITIIILVLKFPFGLSYHDGLLGIVFIPLILAISLNNGRITQLLSKKPLIFLGEISYSLYIYQLPVFYYCKNLPINNLILAFFVKTIILIVLSSLSYLYIETPLREKIKKIDLMKIRLR
jgi:peptidoglycan/LPS O-acetylase OafA/YrhL